MRSSLTTLVLATAAISSVCAGPVKHSHQHFHDKKDIAAPMKFAPHNVKKDLSDVDWSKVHYTYSAGQTWGQATSAAVAEVATATAAAVKATTTAATATSSTKADSVADDIASAVSDVANTIESTISTLINDVDKALISALGALEGLNSDSSSAGIWIGSDGDYSMEISNTADEDVVLFVWGSQGSWVNVKQPEVTVSLPKDEKVTVSFSTGQSGAISAVYSDTKLVNGQVSNTWTEFTFADEYSTIDVSREVLMTGHTMEVVTPECITNMDTCVFVCESGTTCTTGYTLKNCAIGSQTGANTDSASQNGGCTGGITAGANITLTLS